MNWQAKQETQLQKSGPIWNHSQAQKDGIQASATKLIQSTPHVPRSEIGKGHGRWMEKTDPKIKLDLETFTTIRWRLNPDQYPNAYTTPWTHWDDEDWEGGNVMKRNVPLISDITTAL